MTDWKSRQEEDLYNDLTDNSNEVMWKLHLLIESEWDSNTLKQKLEGLVKDNRTIWDEIEGLGK
jgi:hypothetical protein